MTQRPVLVFDFDSTLTRVEALEVLAEIVLEGRPDAAERRAEIAGLTAGAMDGSLSFAQSLKRRLDILRPSRAQIEVLAERLKGEITPSVARNREVFARRAGSVFVITGGFHEFVDPVVAELGIAPEQVLANRLVFDADDRAVDVDPASPLSRDGGKVEAVRALGLGQDVVVVGDGWTDYEIRAAGAARRFYAFTENVARERVMAAADAVAATLDEVLHAEGIAGRFSYPRSRIRVLLLENVHPDAEQRFRAEGYEVETLPGALDEAGLIGRLPGVHVLGLRSKTALTPRALAAADRLLAVGAFCIGTNQIDLEACTERGVAVFNAPFSNTRSVVEMTAGLIVVLMRRLFDKAQAAAAGRWDKSAEGAREVRGKTLGVVGYGAIGAQLSVLAEAMGMAVVFHDTAEKLALGNARRVRSLDALLQAADVVSLHVDGRPENRGLIGERELARMKPGAFLVNLSRGDVVDVEALAGALRSGRLGGAAVDVFPEEPARAGDPFCSPLQGLPNVVLTPHVGGSTEEAQAGIAEFASERLLGYLDRGDTTFCVNLPAVRLAEVGGAHRFLHVHRNQPGVLAGLNGVLAEHGLNILAQHLKTLDQVGYVITDVDRNYGPEAIDALRALPGTLRFRVLY